MGKTSFSSIGPKVVLVLALLVSLQLTILPIRSQAVEEREFLPLNQVSAGMEGIGKTVVEGREISTFSVEVVDVIDQPGQLRDFIIVRASGDPIETSGGVAQGMSGSPIYLDGKLAGALSMAAQWSKDTTRPLALVTPIETMFNLMDEPAKDMQSERNEREEAAQHVMDELFSESSVELERFRTPVMVSDFSEPAFRALKEGVDLDGAEMVRNPLAPLGLEPSGVLTEGLTGRDLTFHNVQGTATASGEAMELEPGGPMGIALSEGDLSIGALGTVTYREEADVLGLGHQFLLSGSSEFLLTRAEVYDTVKSYRASFKMGSVAETVGTISQDRSQGVKGEVGPEVSLLETDLGVARQGEELEKFSTDLVRTSELVGILSYSTIRETITRSLNRTGPGTVKVDYRITGDNLPEPVDRSDIFFSHIAASNLPSLQVAIIIDALAHNPFEEPELKNLEAEVSFQEEISSSQITNFTLGRRQYRPGDLVAYQVTLLNYRGDTVEKTGAFQLPQDVPEGEYVVATYGGPRPLEIAPPEDLRNFEDWISFINNLNSYEKLSVELLVPFDEAVVPMAPTGYRYDSITRFDQRIEDRVVFGSQALAIEVVEEREAGDSPEEDQVDIELEE